jgi:predicted transcriptional regulator
MSTISLRLPESLHDRLRELAKRENVSMNQFVTLALAEKISALAAEDYMVERAARGDREKFAQALAKVADVEPPAHDSL